MRTVVAVVERKRPSEGALVCGRQENYLAEFGTIIYPRILVHGGCFLCDALSLLSLQQASLEERKAAANT